MRLILAPKSAKVFFTVKGLIRHGSVKHSGSPSFWGKFLWMTAKHSSLSLTDEAAFFSFSFCERRSFRTLAPLGMWIIASRKGRLIWIYLKIDRSCLSSSSFFCFFNRDGKGTLDDLEGWCKVGNYGIPSFEFVGVSLPLGHSSSVIPWVADGAGADG
ncbi:hypothetical protein Tco_0922039 [Tanacetum coccineum]|uniref:Uncharacterized protein n=1 Tax=Tanacetum coccineum TaxID=301880 RepID=A0ABQ5CX05_9ASTR